MNVKKFIMTQDEQTAKKLQSLGYQLLSKQGNFWTFLNQQNAVFSADDKIVQTNKLHF